MRILWLKSSLSAKTNGVLLSFLRLIATHSTPFYCRTDTPHISC